MQAHHFETPDLDHRFKIASGGTRDVYVLSADQVGVDTPSGKCVLKIPRQAEQRGGLSVAKRLLAVIFPTSRQRVITKEVSYLKKLQRQCDQINQRLPVPAFLGFDETPLGRGALWEAICDDKGEIAPTLVQLAKSGNISDYLEPLNAFAAFCFQQNIVASDISQRNLALTERDGRREFVLIDGFGDHRVISLRSLFPAYNTRCMYRRFDKMARQIGLQFDSQKRCFKRP